jgi:hypothetical protein
MYVLPRGVRTQSAVEEEKKLRLRILLLVLLAIGAVQLTAAPMEFFANIGNFEQTPTGSPGTGFSLVIIDPVAHTMSVEVDFAGLLSTTTASHIHIINGPGDANTSDTNGPVATAVPTFPGFPLGVMSGTYDNTFDMTMASSYNPTFVMAAGGVSQAEAALFAGIMEGRAYLNIHTNMFPGGEIRGFLQPVPEPATFGIASAALAGFLLLRHRQSRA